MITSSPTIVRTLGEEVERTPRPGDMLFARSIDFGQGVTVQVLCVIAVGSDEVTHLDTIDCICITDAGRPEIFRLRRRDSAGLLRAYGSIFWVGIWSGTDSIMIAPFGVET